MNPDLRIMTNQRLGALCNEQNDQFKQNCELNDGHVCFELIRRAVFRIDDAADVVFEIYYNWLQRKIIAMFQRNDDAVEDLTQDAMLRFFSYVTPNTWGKFKNLAHILAYMGKCGQSVVYNYWRQCQTVQKYTQTLEEHHEESVSDTAEIRPIENNFEQNQATSQLWQCVKKNCRDALDLFLAQQLWQYGLQPKDVAKKYPNRFPKPVEVYKRKRNLIDRIKRDTTYRTLAVAF